jgi:hypothetical protein
MGEIAIHVENSSTRYRVGPREPHKARRGVITDVFVAPFRRLRENSQFAIRNSQCSSGCRLPAGLSHFAIRHSKFAMFFWLPSAHCLLASDI